MVQIVNISQARSNLAKLFDEINKTKQPVVIIKDSNPSVVVYPYEQMYQQDEQEKKIRKEQFNTLFREGRKAFKKYLKDKSIKKKKLTEEEVYEIIENA